MSRKNKAAVPPADAQSKPVVKVDEAFVEALQGKAVALFAPMLAEAVLLKLEAGSYNSSDTAPGYGQVSFEIGLPEIIVAKMKDAFGKEAAARGIGVGNVKVLGRVTFEFSSLVDGKGVTKGEIDWNAYAGKADEGEDKGWDFTLLDPKWLGQSFVYAMNEYGDFWYTIVGLSPSSAKPVLVVCNDKDDADGTVYRLQAELIEEHIKQMATRKISPELEARKPDGAVVAKWVARKPAAPKAEPAKTQAA